MAVKFENSIIEDEVKKIHNRILRWFQNKDQYNSRILYAFIKLVNKLGFVSFRACLDAGLTFIKLVNKLGFVSVSDLEEEVKFTTFMENYNQMKIISLKNHGKIFEEKDGKVYFGDEVKDFIWNYYE